MSEQVRNREMSKESVSKDSHRAMEFSLLPLTQFSCYGIWTDIRVWVSSKYVRERRTLRRKDESRSH